MLLRDAPSLEVLLLRRSRATPFVPGAHVFPGGAVDPGDADPRLLALVDGLDETTASEVLGTTTPGLPFWLAAVRESLEEAGVVLARAGDDPVPPDHPLFAELATVRRQVERGETNLADHLERHGLRLALDDLAYVAQWITPPESPRRYDTRFFAARMPEGQDVVVDEWEAVEASWWRPAAALDAWQAGDIDLIEPTVASLALLAELPSADKALSALHEGARRPERIREPAGGIRVPLPSEPAGDER
jgi:8-oxo-dGTP pyrophosphatase MutT (NUDIX family)